MKYQQLSSGDRENIIRPELLGSCLVKIHKAPELNIKYDKLSSGDREKNYASALIHTLLIIKVVVVEKEYLFANIHFLFLVTIYNDENVLINLLLMNFNIESFYKCFLLICFVRVFCDVAR